MSGGSGSGDRLGGGAFSLRNEGPTATPVQQPGSPLSELGPVSPELALVDPELGRAARALLPDRPRTTPVGTPVAVASVTEHSAFVERLRGSLEPIPDLARPRRRVRLGRLSAAAGFIALGLLLTLLVDRERGPTPRQQQTQSVAAAVSPPKSSPAQTERSATTPTSTSTTPATSGPLHGQTTPGKTFVWAAALDTAAYEFQLFQGGERIFRARVDEPRLELPGRWRLGGLPHALLPGRYRWSVWSISRQTNRRSTVPIVQAKLVIDR